MRITAVLTRKSVDRRAEKFASAVRRQAELVAAAWQSTGTSGFLGPVRILQIGTKRVRSSRTDNRDRNGPEIRKTRASNQVERIASDRLRWSRAGGPAPQETIPATVPIP